jgi:hypothetical protein
VAVQPPIESLPEALLKVPPDTVIKGIVIPRSDGTPPRLETDFGTLTVVASTPLPAGRVLSLRIQSADVHLVTVPIALDDHAPAPTFPNILMLAPVPEPGTTAAPADNTQTPGLAALAKASVPPAEGEQKAVGRPRPLPQQGLPAVITELPVGARLAGTLLPVAAANKFLLVARDTVLGLTLAHRPDTPEAAGRPFAVPNTGARLEIEIRGVATHLNAQLVAIADAPITNAKTSVILGPVYVPDRSLQPTQNHAPPSTAPGAPVRTERSGLSIGQTVPATVQPVAAPSETQLAPTTSGPPAATEINLVLRRYGGSRATDTALLPGAMVTATVIGHDHQGALLVGVSEQTLRVATAAPFPPGTSLTFEVLPPPLNDLSTLAPPAGVAGAPRRLDSLTEVIQALAASDPNAHAATVANVLPNAGGGAMAKLIAYLFALKSGDARQLLGARASSALERIGRGALLGRLGDELRMVERGLGDTANEWRQLPLPFLDGDRLGVITAWLYDGRRGRGDDGGEQPDDETHVIIDLSLSRLGEIRVAGTYRPGRFDMSIASEAPFEDPVRYNMIRIFDDILAVSGMAGALSFRAHASAVTPDAPPNPS